MTPACRPLTLPGRASHSLTPLVSRMALLKSLSFSFSCLLTDFLESALGILYLCIWQLCFSGFLCFNCPALQHCLLKLCPGTSLKKISFLRTVFFDFEVLKCYLYFLPFTFIQQLLGHILGQKSLLGPPVCFCLVGSH